MRFAKVVSPNRIEVAKKMTQATETEQRLYDLLGPLNPTTSTVEADIGWMLRIKAVEH